MNVKHTIIPIIAIILTSFNLRPAITSVSPLLGTIRESLHMSAASSSLLTSLAVLCMGLFAPFAIKLANRFSIERAIAYSLILIGLATAARFFAYYAWVMLLTAFLAGIGIAIAGPLLSGFIKQNFTNPSRVVGIYSLALVVGASLGSGLSIPLSSLFHTWQASAASWAILAVIAVFFWWKPIEKMPVTNTVSDTSSADNNLKQLLTDQKAWLLTVFFGLMAFMFYTIMAWLPPIVEDMGYSKQQAGMMLTLLTVAQMPATFLVPILNNRLQHRAVWLVGCSSLELIGLFLLLFSVNPWLSSLLIGIGAGGLFSLGLTLPIDEAKNIKEASILAAMTQSVGFVFAALGPLFVGLVRDYTGNFTAAIIGMVVIVIAMILIQIKLGNQKHQQIK
ncbi:MFS transporter [Lysinibacillus agricola]|uniref:MFS transporter n=1 Tax=Lysinibacillus agricola TaxID=2590012 RepID=A0ABX7AX93_9BACI|nr:MULTISPECIES: MFS transporter [Lysinibacillus]KOS61829.1 MFS transporter [Lysinibacillus sp. FJAT-14222]QQP14122.1 MFS transporter [Lysinibacillus agricola]